MATDYDTQFFNVIREGCKASAEAVVPVVMEHLDPKPRAVVDVGCGEGWWGKAFEDLGCEAWGIEAYGEPVIANVKADLLDPLPDAKADLALCLEVAEHLPRDRANSFIAELCQLAPVVLFSAAIPGQGGAGHLNEQWPAYWVERFEKQGYRVTGDLRWEIWQDERVENWYRQNLLIACADPIPVSLDLAFRFDRVLPVVHPVLFDARRADAR